MARLCCLLLLTPAFACGDEPKPQVIFDEDFKQVAQMRFKMLRPGQTDQNLAAGSVTMHPGTGWVRPAFAGFTCEYSLKLDFPTLDKNGASTKSDFFFVMHNRQIGGVRMMRERQDGVIAASIRIVKTIDAEGKDTTTELRTISVKGDLPNGDWTLRYRHGLIIVLAGGKELARGFLQVPSAAVLGVTWEQHTGKMTCGGMKLTGILPTPQTKEQQAELKEAAELNDRGMKLYREGRVAESLESTSAAAMRYVKNLGDNHHDSANAHENLGVIFQQSGRAAEAQNMFAKALNARLKVLGDDHPRTGRALFHLGLVHASQKNHREARDCFEKCLKIVESSGDTDGNGAQVIRDQIEKLPK